MWYSVEAAAGVLGRKARFGVDFLSSHKELIDSYLKAGYISVSDDRIALTERGFYVSNSILTELI